MTLTYKLDLDKVKSNRHAKYLDQMSFYHSADRLPNLLIISVKPGLRFLFSQAMTNRRDFCFCFFLNKG